MRRGPRRYSISLVPSDSTIRRSLSVRGVSDPLLGANTIGPDPVTKETVCDNHPAEIASLLNKLNGGSFSEPLTRLRGLTSQKLAHDVAGFGEVVGLG
jgi:hypothetical protein